MSDLPGTSQEKSRDFRASLFGKLEVIRAPSWGIVAVVPVKRDLQANL
jgi:hypothetical protein